MAKDSFTEQLLDKIKVIADRLDSLEKTVQFINSERSILEDIRTSHVALKELMLNQREHTDNLFKDLKSELKIQSIRTVDKLEEAQEKTEEIHDKVEEVKKEVKVTQDQNKEIIKQVEN